MDNIEKLYKCYEVLSEAGEKVREYEKEYKEILKAVKGSSKEKRLASQFIGKFFKHFPVLADDVFIDDAQLDIWEDENIQIPCQAIKDLPQLCKDHIGDALAQLLVLVLILISTELQVNNSLQTIIMYDAKVALTGIFSRILTREKCFKFIAKIFSLGSEVINKDVEEEIKTVLQDVTADEFHLCTNILISTKLGSTGHRELVNLAIELGGAADIDTITIEDEIVERTNKENLFKNFTEYVQYNLIIYEHLSTLIQLEFSRVRKVIFYRMTDSSTNEAGDSEEVVRVSVKCSDMVTNNAIQVLYLNTDLWTTTKRTHIPWLQKHNTMENLRKNISQEIGKDFQMVDLKIWIRRFRKSAFFKQYARRNKKIKKTKTHKRSNMFSDNTTAIPANSTYSNTAHDNTTAIPANSTYSNTAHDNTTAIPAYSTYLNTAHDNTTAIPANSTYSNTAVNHDNNKSINWHISQQKIDFYCSQQDIDQLKEDQILSWYTTNNGESKDDLIFWHKAEKEILLRYNQQQISWFQYEQKIEDMKIQFSDK